MLKEHGSATIDIFEKDLLPFGLIRYGVSPDHQDVKKIENDMNRVAQSPNLRYHGGISIVKKNL